MAGTLPPPTQAAAAPPARSARWIPWRTLLAAAGGLVLVLAFPGFGLSALAPSRPGGPGARRPRPAVPLRRSGSGWSSGWRSSSRCSPGPASTSGPLPWLALAVWEALHLALLGGATALTSRLPLWPLWTAALWVADEAVRGRFVLGGFPWGRLGFSQTSGPLLSFAAYGGVPLVSFAVALTGALLAAAVLALHRAWRSADVPGERGPALRGRRPCSSWPSWPCRWPACWPGCRCPGPR